ncbi:MAG: sigma-70 family RNA polymerase sigma factor, partial [Cyanobacteria bacterium J06650_10]
AQDNLVDDEVMSGMDGVLAIAAETDRQQQQQMLSTELTKAIQQLKPPGEKLLRYYYCDGLKQKDIAQALEIKQYAVSRKLTQARSALLSALIAQRQSGKTVSADDAIDLDTIESMSNALELWLHDSFCQP